MQNIAKKLVVFRGGAMDGGEHEIASEAHAIGIPSAATGRWVTLIYRRTRETCGDRTIYEFFGYSKPAK